MKFPCHLLLALVLLRASLGSAAPAGVTTRPATAPASAPAARYQVINLGTLGGDSSIACAINSRGHVAGTAQIAYAKPRYFWQGRKSHPFLWRDGVMRDLGLPPGAKDPRPYVDGLNTHGDVAGTVLSSSEFHRAFMYVGGKMTDLAPPGSRHSAAFAINDQRVVVGYSSSPPGGERGGEYTAVTWKDGRPRRVGGPDERDTVARAINSRGQIVGRASVAWRTTDGGVRPVVRAVLWEGGQRRILGDLAGDLDEDPETRSEALAINDRGQIAGETLAPPVEGDIRPTRGFLWADGRMTDLGTLAGHFHSVARALNNRGQIVGSSQPWRRVSRAFLYEDGAMIDLNALIPRDSGWELIEARGINDAGEICGLGYFQGSEATAFLLRPTRKEPAPPADERRP